MYEHWADVSFSGFADLISVAVDENDRVIGYGTAKYCIDENIVNFFGKIIGANILFSVSPEARGRNVYGDIFAYNCDTLFKRHIDFIQAVTQLENRHVQRAWTSLGLRLTYSGHSFHGIVE
jgi:hypothetical protein